MGLIDFVKDAGRKLGLGGGGEDEAGAAAARADALRDLVVKLGLEVEDLAIELDGGVATVRGTAASKEMAEKVVLAVGNTRGVAQVDDMLAYHMPGREKEMEEERRSTLYTVVSGDTLSRISLAHYGDAMKYMAIFEANRPMLEDPDLIYPGQVLRIPPLEG